MPFLRLVPLSLAPRLISGCLLKQHSRCLMSAMISRETPIYTLGFGYALQRGLLYDLAKEGNGNTGHIPDGSMIATVFNNFIGNILCTTAVNIQLYIKMLNGALIIEDPLMGDYTFSVDASGVICVNLGTIQMAQSRNMIINFNNIRSMPNDTPFMEYRSA